MSDSTYQFLKSAYWAIFLAKPLWYTLLLLFARKRLAEPASIGRLVLGALGRVALGLTFVLVMTHGSTDEVNLFNATFARFVVLAMHGSLCWFVIMKLMFRRSAASALFNMAVLAELASLVIDAPLTYLIGEFHFC